MSPRPVGDALCDGSAGPVGRRCPAPDCGRLLTSSRARYCDGTCRMRALRHRRLLASSRQVVQEQAPRPSVGQFVYECTRCGERFLGERRCPECQLYTRNLGLGGPCPDCDHPIVLAELLPALAPPSTSGRRR